MKFEELVEEFQRWLGPVDREALAIVSADVLSSRSPGIPLWIFLVGPSGAGKTTLLEAIPKNSFAIGVSSLTSRSFVSGAYQDAHADLLPQLKGRCLVVHDFASVLAKPFHEREAIFSILRECYDNRQISVRYGSVGEKKFPPVRFSFVAGCTSALDAYKSVSDALGQRNLILRLHSGDRAVENAQATLGHEAEAAKALAKALLLFLRERASLCSKDIVVGPSARTTDRRWAAALAVARCPVSRDRQHHVQTRPEPEVATRIIKQFGELRRLGSIVMDVSPDDDLVSSLIRRVARNSIPRERLELLQVLLEKTIMSTGKIAERLRMHKPSVHEWLENLWILEIAGRSQVNKEDIWQVSAQFYEMAADLLVDPAVETDVVPQIETITPNVSTSKTVSFRKKATNSRRRRP